MALSNVDPEQLRIFFLKNVVEYGHSILSGWMPTNLELELGSHKKGSGMTMIGRMSVYDETSWFHLRPRWLYQVTCIRVAMILNGSNCSHFLS